MRAMVLHEARQPLRLEDLATPEPADGQVLVRVGACGVCRTDLHITSGELTKPKLPLIIGHQVVGTVERVGRTVTRFNRGQRIGVPWLGFVDEDCRFCRRGMENLCEHARFTGYDLDGGYAEYLVADERFCLPIPDGYEDLQAAPLLCAGLIGFRALRFAGGAERIGLYGFGASAHIVAQVARHEGRKIFAFTSPGDTKTQDFARGLGAAWAGDSLTDPPEPLEAAIVFAPVGSLVPAALKVLEPGGIVVCAGIHMSDIPAFPYDWLWKERQIRSVANLTRRDGEEFMKIAASLRIRIDAMPYPLAEANRALDDLAHGRFRGAAVLTIGS